MSEKTEALRLAQALNNRQECEDEAAAELRRLSAVEAQRDALLEALRVFVSCASPVSTEIDERGYRWIRDYLDQALPIARAAIKAVEGDSHAKGL